MSNGFDPPDVFWGPIDDVHLCNWCDEPTTERQREDFSTELDADEFCSAECRDAKQRYMEEADD